jgi:hypothetical protein
VLTAIGDIEGLLNSDIDATENWCGEINAIFDAVSSAKEFLGDNQ